MLDVNSSVKDWLPHVHEEEHWHEGEHESDPVPGEAHVDHTVSLKGGEWVPPSVVGGLGAERHLLLSQTLDVLVDSALQLGLHLVSLDHLHDLLLLLVNRRVLGADLAQALIDIVVETLTHILLNLIIN